MQILHPLFSFLVSEEERQKRSQFFLSVKEYVEKHPDLHSKLLKNNLNNSKKKSKQDEQRHRQGRGKGSKKGARRNATNLQNWNRFDEPDKGRPRRTVDLTNKIQVATVPGIPGVRNRTPGGETESEAEDKVKETARELTEKLSGGVMFLEHALGLGVDIIYPFSMKEHSGEENVTAK